VRQEKGESKKRKDPFDMGGRNFDCEENIKTLLEMALDWEKLWTSRQTSSQKGGARADEERLGKQNRSKKGAHNRPRRDPKSKASCGILISNAKQKKGSSL